MHVHRLPKYIINVIFRESIYVNLAMSEREGGERREGRREEFSSECAGVFF